MKLLLDQNISHRLVKKVDAVFPGSEQVRRLGLENATDFDIWSFAQKNGFAIVTFDSDFFNLNILYGSPPKIIWLRTGNTASENILKLIVSKQDAILEYLGDDNNSACLELIDLEQL